MNKYKKILAEDATKKELVMEILKLLNGESYSDSKEILDIAAAFLKEQCYLDFDLARDIIEDLGES